MKLPNATKRVAICALSSACIPTSGVLAQDDQNQVLGLIELEEIVVTARKREESLKDVPISVAAISGEDLFNAGQDNLEDLTASLTNVYFTQDANSRARFSVRGIGPDASGIQGPGVGFFIDGVYQAFTGPLNTPFFDLERVEVLKGPQGTLYGRNSLGGVINFITPKPAGGLNGAVGAEIGTHGTSSIAAAVGGALVEDALYGRVSMQKRDTDGPYDNLETGEPAYPLETEQIRGRLVWDATDNLEFDLTASYFESNGATGIYSQVENLQNLVDNYRSVGESISDIDTTDFNLTATYSFDSFDLRSQTTSHQQDWEYEVDGDLGPAENLRIENPADLDVWAQELRLISTNDSAFQWLAGIEYAKTDVESTNNSYGPFIDDLPELSFLDPLTGAGAGSMTEQERELWAGFIDLTYALGDKVELGFGLRYDNVESKLTGQNRVNFPFDTLLLELPFPDATIKQEEWQPKFTVTANWTDALTNFFAISRGFREGGFNQAAAGSSQESFDGDSVWNTELGFRWEGVNGRLQLEGALFYIDWQDSTGSLLSATGIGGVVLNLGDAVSQGVEFAGKFAATDHIVLSAAGGVLDCEYEEVSIPSGLVSAGVFEGDQCLYSSDWNFNVGSDVAFPLADSGYELIGGLNILGRGDTKVGLHTASDDDRTVQDAYYLANVSLGIRNDAYTLTLFGENVTDEQYATSAVTQDTVPASQSDTVILGQPETYGLRLRADF